MQARFQDVADGRVAKATHYPPIVVLENAVATRHRGQGADGVQ